MVIDVALCFRISRSEFYDKKNNFISTGASVSIAFKDVAGYFEIPLLLIISISFFLLEKSATPLQDPFENKPTDIAVTAIARTIEINIRQMLKETSVPQPQQPAEFYLM